VLRTVLRAVLRKTMLQPAMLWAAMLWAAVLRAAVLLLAVLRAAVLSMTVPPTVVPAVVLAAALPTAVLPATVSIAVGRGGIGGVRKTQRASRSWGQNKFGAQIRRWRTHARTDARLKGGCCYRCCSSCG